MLELLTLLATCSPPPPGFYDTRPPPGSTLPANAQVVLLGYQFSPSSAQVTISQLDAIYSVTPIIEEGIVRVDVGALGVRGPITLFATSTEPGAMSVQADFTVADEADTTPPPFKGIDSLTYEYMEEDMPGLCWPGGFQVRAQITPATDDWATTHYQLYEVLPNDALRWAGNTHHSESRSLGIVTYPGHDQGTRCYVAFATDVGGNVAPELVRGGLCIDLIIGGSDAGVSDAAEGDSSTFDTGVEDGGVRDTGVKSDAGTLDSGTGGELELDDRGGCGCTAAERTERASPLWLLLLIFAVLARPSSPGSRAR
jgi:hypothetical protein